MIKRLFSTIILSIIACVAVNAQGLCVINGHIADSRLGDGSELKKVYLTRVNEFGQPVTVAEAKVKKGSYTFEYELAQDEPVLLYTVAGFGEGMGIELFVEPGEITVNTPSAAQPCVSKVVGTPVNDAYTEFMDIFANGYKEVEKEVAALVSANSNEWLESAEGKAAVGRIESKEGINTVSQAIRFLIGHNASPMMPLVVECYLLHLLTPAYAEQVMNAVSTSLYTHPYYLSLRNRVLANNLKVGNEAPDITLPLLGGETKRLSDYRGKYVVLNFWASGCAKSAEMFAELQKLYDLVKEYGDEFVIVSVSLDTDKAAWAKAVESNGINREGWLHACDGAGTVSPAAELFGLENTPKILLIEPEGRAVSLDMEIGEVVMRADQILMGDLYYLDQIEE